MRSHAALALLLGFVLLTTGAARAMRYEVFIEVRSEQELYDLRNEGQISEESFETLRTLMSQPPSLDSSSRSRLRSLPNIDVHTVDEILRHRSTASPPISLEELVDAGILTQRVASSLRPFVLAPGKPRDASEVGVRGFLRLQTRMTGRYDRYPPASALRAGLHTTRGLRLGVAASLLRSRVGQARYHRAQNALIAAPPRARLVVPKLFLLWEGRRWKLVAGTYRIGFGERLLFDSTAEAAPHGFVGDEQLTQSWALRRRCAQRSTEAARPACPDGGAIRVTPDYAWTNRQTGLALGHRASLGRGRRMETHVWGSYQLHRVSQYELRLASQCADPRNDEDEACEPVPVLVAGQDANGPVHRWTATSLPRLYAEALGGANLSFFWKRRSHIGITGYAAKLRWSLRDVELGLQESARRPFGGAYGALGLNLAHGKPRQELRVELARSFDRQSPSRGGWAALARSVSKLPSAQIEISARYYASTYANPHARPSSAADELEGLRARDEAGLRLRTRLQLGEKWSLLGSADLWRELSTQALKSELRLRADFEPKPSLWASIWTLQRMTPDRQAITTATRMNARPSERLRVSSQLQLALSRTQPRRSFSKAYGAIATLTLTACDQARLSLRLRYDLELEPGERGLGAQTFWAYLDLALELARGNRLQLRYDLRHVVAEPWSRAQRLPNPEHWLSIEYEWRSP